LLLVEWQEERWRFFEALLLAGVIFILALMTLMVVTVTIVVVCLIEHRLGLVVRVGPGLFAGHDRPVTGGSAGD